MQQIDVSGAFSSDVESRAPLRYFMPYERQQKEFEAEQKRREKLNKARIATFDRIQDNAPAMFTAAQLRTFLRLLVHIAPYSFLEEVASHFVENDEKCPANRRRYRARRVR